MSWAWMSGLALAEMSAEANRAYPLETGGMLVGYRADNGQAVITNTVGPGPHAVHRRYRFVPDHAWQCARLDELYASSEGVSVYLGDWHTHPDGAPNMSRRDRRTLAAIAQHPQSRTTQPIMLIGGGAPSARKWVMHEYQSSTLFGCIVYCRQAEWRAF